VPRRLLPRIIAIVCKSDTNQRSDKTASCMIAASGYSLDPDRTPFDLSSLALFQTKVGYSRRRCNIDDQYQTAIAHLTDIPIDVLIDADVDYSTPLDALGRHVLPIQIHLPSAHMRINAYPPRSPLQAQDRSFPNHSTPHFNATTLQAAAGAGWYGYPSPVLCIADPASARDIPDQD
jgi:hypothetical protein